LHLDIFDQPGKMSFSTACILLTLTVDVDTFALRATKGMWF
jgi:hypothetical protein